jgi:hypothetical protein
VGVAAAFGSAAALCLAGTVVLAATRTSGRPRA